MDIISTSLPSLGGVSKVQQNAKVGYAKENIYDIDNIVSLEHYSKRILALLGSDAKEYSVLDLGLGHGYTAKILDDRFNEYTIIDGDSYIIEKYNQEHPNHNAKIIFSFFEDYDTEKKYDVIIAGFILEHVEDPIQILKKYIRYLKTNGRFFVCVPNATSLNRQIGYEMGILKDMYALSDNDRNLGHRRYYDINSIKKDCEIAGLKVVRTEGIYLKPFTTRQILSLNLPESAFKGLCNIGVRYPELCTGIMLETVINK